MDKKLKLAIAEVGMQYKKLSPSLVYYLKIKHQIFPISKLLSNLDLGSKILDIGCGNGYLTQILARAYLDKNFVGIDVNEKEISIARKGQSANVIFSSDLVLELDLGKYDTILSFDVFYLLNFQIQKELIKKISKNLPEGGVFYLKEMDKRPSWKYCFNYLQELMSVRLFRWTTGGHFYFRSTEQWKTLLLEYFSKVDVYRLDKGFAYPHILLKAKK